MGQVFQIHPQNPQLRVLMLAVRALQHGGVIVYPTDSCYAFGCLVGDRAALQTICDIRQLDAKHQFTLMCRDLSELSRYARVENAHFRLLKAKTPGPYTFVLRASRDVPRRMQGPKRKTIGLRIPQHVVVQNLLSLLGQPLLSCSLILPGDDEPLTDMHEIAERMIERVDIVLLSTDGRSSVTTIVDLSINEPVILRRGLGDIDDMIES